MGLDVALVDGLCRELPLDHHVGFRETVVRFAHLVLEVVGDIADLVRFLAQGRGFHVLVQDRRAVLHGLQHARDVRQHFVFHVDQFHRLLRHVQVDGGHTGDGMALVQHFAVGQYVVAGVAQVDDRLAQVGELVRDLREVVGRDNGPHARMGLRAAGVDVFDPRVGMGTALDGAVQQPRQLDIGAVDRPAGDLVHPVVANRTGADDLMSVL